MRKSIKSINGLYDLLKEINEFKSPIYRGHSSTKYKLKSSSFRRLENKYEDNNKVKRNISLYHEQLIEEFKANKYHQNTIGELTDLEILAKLQHYGAATCFLDFSRNIAVALWFACSSKEDSDGQLYILKNTQDVINYKRINQQQLQFNISKFYSDFYSEKENELVKHFLLWEPPYLSERILQQDSIFLFSKKEDELDDDEYLHKVVIDKKIKKDVLEILDRLFNINKKTIYKDFHGFAISHAQNESIDFIEDGLKFLELANQYFQANRDDKALEYYDKAIVDIDDEDKLTEAYENLSFLYKNLIGDDNLKRALEYQQKVITIKEKVLDKNSPSLASSYNKLSGIYQDLDGESNLQKALEYQNLAIEINKKILDKNQPSLATNYNNLALIYKDIGEEENLKEALKYQKLAIEINKGILDKNHPSLVTNYNNLSLVYCNLRGEENLRKALKYQNKAIEISEKVLDKNHPSLSRNYNNLSMIYKDLGKAENLREALKYQNKAIEISEKLLDKNHPSFSTFYNNLSMIYKDLGGAENLREALKYQNKAIDIREKVLDKNHPSLAISYSNLSSIYMNLNGEENLKKALIYIDKAMMILNLAFPNGNENLEIWERKRENILKRLNH